MQDLAEGAAEASDVTDASGERRCRWLVWCPRPRCWALKLAASVSDLDRAGLARPSQRKVVLSG